MLIGTLGRFLSFLVAEVGVGIRCVVVVGSALSLAAVVVWWRAYLLYISVAVTNIAALSMVMMVVTHIGIGIWTTWLWTRGRGLHVWVFAAWIPLQLATVPIHWFSWIGSEGLAGHWKVRGPY